MPVLHIGRLAVDVRYQGRGVGSLLLTHAAELAIKASDEIGCHALELVAFDADAYSDYIAKGFQPLKEGGKRLFLTVDELRRARAQA